MPCSNDRGYIRCVQSVKERIKLHHSVVSFMMATHEKVDVWKCVAMYGRRRSTRIDSLKSACFFSFFFRFFQAYLDQATWIKQPRTPTSQDGVREFISSCRRVDVAKGIASRPQVQFSVQY